MTRFAPLPASNAFASALLLAGCGVLERPLSKGEAARVVSVLERGQNDLLARAQEHRLSSMVLRGLDREGLLPRLSPRLVQVLEHEHKTARVRQVMLHLALRHLTHKLSEESIQVLACKGVVVAQRWYPKEGLRVMQDIDLWLLNPESYERAAAILRALGYRENEHKFNGSAHQFQNDLGVQLDVHLKMGFLTRRGFELGELSEPAPGGDYRVLVPAAQLAHLVVHLLGHAQGEGVVASWLVDIALLLRSPELDVNQVRSCLPDDGSWAFLCRLLRAFVQLAWIDEALARDFSEPFGAPLSWGAIERHRRRAAYRGGRGAARFLLRPFRDNGSGVRVPGPRDWLAAPLDHLFEGTAWLAGEGALFRPRPRERHDLD